MIIILKSILFIIVWLLTFSFMEHGLMIEDKSTYAFVGGLLMLGQIAFILW